MQLKPIKFAIHMLAPVLPHIRNLGLSTDILPEDMHVAKIITLNKDRATRNLDNYSPISILPISSKGIEMIIQSRLSFSTKITQFQTSSKNSGRRDLQKSPYGNKNYSLTRSKKN